MFDGMFLPQDLRAADGRRVLDPLDSINRGLAARFPLTEAGGKLADNLVPGGARGTLVNAPSRVITRLGRATKFNGSNSYIDVPGFSWPASSPVTVSWWAKLTAAAPARASAFSVGNSSTFQAHAPWSDSTLYWDYGSNELSASLAAYLGTTVRIGLVSKSSGFRAIYINGKKVSSDTTSSAPGALSGLTIGAWLGVSAYEEAALQDFAIWRRVLADAEHLRLATEPWAGMYDPTSRLFHPLKGGANLLSLTLTGQAATFSSGTLVSSSALPLSGTAATASAGSVVAGATLSLVGAASAAAAGTVAPGIGAAVSGSAITSAAGTLGYTASLSISGAGMAAAGGTLGATGGTFPVSVSIRGELVRVLPGNVRVRGGTRWVEPTAQAVALPSTIDNTLPPPPRLVGDPRLDTQAQQQWLATVYDQMVKRMNVLGRVSDHEERLARLENPDTSSN